MREYYERRAAEYDATAYKAAEAAEVERLTAFVAGLAPARTLDVACGTGYLTRHLRGEVVALDQSATMLEVARRVLPGVELVRADVPPLPFDDDAFDRVFTSHFYGHIASTREREHLVTEAMRVARELVVVEQGWRPGLPHETWERRELRDGSRHRIFKRYYKAEELRHELGGAVALETRAFIAVRADREPPTSDQAPERSPPEPD
jgi:ubiquinone/menaquinone biosynthesis C-methylase UbiE